MAASSTAALSVAAGRQTENVRMNAWHMGEWVILRPLWILPALLLLIASLASRHNAVRSHWKDVLSPALFHYLGAENNRLSRWNLPLLIASLVTLSLCQPVLRKSDDETWRHSIGWIMVADVSRSMTLDDTVPSRLGAMREALAELSRQADARPIALILFSGDAFLVAPPAFDRSVFNEHTALLEHGLIPMKVRTWRVPCHWQPLSSKKANFARHGFSFSEILEVSAKAALPQHGSLQMQDIRLICWRLVHQPPGRLKTTSQNLPVAVQAGASNSLLAMKRSSTGNRYGMISKAGNGISVKANAFGVIELRPS